MQYGSLLVADISVGDHPVWKVLGLTVNADTVWATAVAGLIVIVLGMVLRAGATSAVPGKLQLAFEVGVDAIEKQVDSSIGPRGRAVAPLAFTLFLFILVSNWFEVIGLGSKYEVLPAPTGDINLPLAMAAFVIILVHAAALWTRGPIGYVKHYVAQPFPKFLFPLNLFINVVEEIAKPITLALRLFGNLLSGGLMLSLIAALAVWKLGGVPIGDVTVLIFNPVWKLFDLAIGAIQAFIFALLTILYFDVAMSEDH